MFEITHTDIHHLGEYAYHLKGLTAEDKHSRFGYVVSDYNIDQLILSMIYHPDQHHLWRATVDDRVVGWGHMAYSDGSWELALSVDKNSQRHGYGGKIIREMLDWAKFQNITSVFMHCIEDNRAVQHLATKNKLKTVSRGDGERTSAIEVPPPTALETNAHLFQEQAEIVAQIVQLRSRLAQLWNPFVQKH